PLQLQDNHPILPAEFEGRRGLFRLDVGANIALLMHGPTVNDLNLLDGRETAEIDLGSQKGKAGKIESLELAGQKFTDVDAVFTEEVAGIFADTHTAGNIGMPLLSSFRIVLDYRNERIALIRKDG
ncbi:MAG: hypothetical protein HKN12_04115, partial [Gemmatimonadetes bacterium]|nr:hypothetical protein [Gemmatimonadota bacterium]